MCMRPMTFDLTLDLILQQILDQQLLIITGFLPFPYIRFGCTQVMFQVNLTKYSKHSKYIVPYLNAAENGLFSMG